MVQLEQPVHHRVRRGQRGRLGAELLGFGDDAGDDCGERADLGDEQRRDAASDPGAHPARGGLHVARNILSKITRNCSR
mgnify:CR=1 FL=1